ncbi:MAG: TatD family hydrolase [Clostridium sp.]
MYIEAHTHLEGFKDNIEKAIEIINDKKIITLANSMDIESYLLNLEYAKKSQYIVPCFGIHPWSVKKVEFNKEEITEYIKECKMVGEIGLDFFWEEDKSSYPKQLEVFEFFIEKSKKYNKVVNIHTKGAEKEILEILSKYNYYRCIIHWYSGPLDILKELIDKGCYVTISVDVGYSKLTDEIIDSISIDKILTETDGPTALEWVNGEYAYPDKIIDIVDYIAERKNISNKELKEIIYMNYYTLINNIDRK